MKPLKVLAAITLLLIFYSFSAPVNEGIEMAFGVSENNPSKIELRLAKDFTFSYQDFSNPNHKIEVRGTYTITNKKVRLSASNNDIKFHDLWNLSTNSLKAKSRKGMTFYSLCKIN